MIQEIPRPCSAIEDLTSASTTELLIRSGVSAVILNWSRFENVVLIVSGLCDPSLRDVVSEIIVSRLRIVNSPENLYFQARFIACSAATFKYCFIQDDDYFVRPEVIRTLHSRIRLTGIPKSIHLLPPHEHLSSASLTGYSLDGRIHTRFAWVGHGTMMHRELSESFLALMDDLNFSSEERKMADNYFTLLRNDFTEIWHDQGIELGGGQPFTVGTEGEQRNRLHIGNALAYLDEHLGSSRGHPYVLQDTQSRLPRERDYAVCLGRTCLLSASLPGSLGDTAHQVGVAKDLLLMVANSSIVTGSLESGLSRAADADPKTYFESKQDAQVGDFFTLDLTGQVGPLDQGKNAEIALLVDAATADLLHGAQVDHSPDEGQWSPPVTQPSCHKLELYGGELTECCFRLRGDVSSARHLRVTLKNLKEKAPWRIHEIWARASSAKTVVNVA
ncbi:hypothetical protein BJ322DRAFT_1204137 [Thelephora terrestris]|uniref:Uncharacterized protein n=1 Tax=Thelephora terrestris TaxID=56493 RepID=A0A9P6HEL7_9AGAM|nr:hypothetical protein BJ322DRAFT_1204137 [Thelephora terrestris]